MLGIESYYLVRSKHSRRRNLIYHGTEGFSRGAYTARALAGMLHKVGSELPSHHSQIDRAVIPDWPTREGQHSANSFCIQDVPDFKQSRSCQGI